ncbi:MAG TPA: GTP cyclohydrolase FolE2 [Casimicrobiaceae bacterium]|jgi:GTP cyclohydrolase I
MNKPQQPDDMLAPIADVQARHDDRDIAIDQVGIRGLRYPLNFVDGDGVARGTVATCNVYVALPAAQKGTHMSRLVALLEECASTSSPPLSVANFRVLLDDLVSRLNAPGGRIEFAFPFFVRKTAPVSGVASLLDYEVKITGEISGGRYEQTLDVVAPVTSLCPCSKEISDYGAHSQRSTVRIVARPLAPVFVVDLLRIAEEEASAELYGILKRADEKYVTERAYNNPRFVEDLVRGVAKRLADDVRIGAFAVEAENFESIHNHSAFARISRGV